MTVNTNELICIFISAACCNLTVGHHHHQALHTINFDIFLTVHLSIFILVINQLDAQNLFYNKFIS